MCRPSKEANWIPSTHPTKDLLRLLVDVERPVAAVRAVEVAVAGVVLAVGVADVAVGVVAAVDNVGREVAK